MIISRTPLRISFMGGGSDLPAFYRQEPGTRHQHRHQQVHLHHGQQEVRPPHPRQLLGHRNRRSPRRVEARIDPRKPADDRRARRHRNHLDLRHPFGGHGHGLVELLYRRPAERPARLSRPARRRGAAGRRRRAASRSTSAASRSASRTNTSPPMADSSASASTPTAACSSIPSSASRKPRRNCERRLLLFYTGITRSANPILEEQNRTRPSNAPVAHRLADRWRRWLGDARRAVPQRAGQFRRNAARKLAAEEEPCLDDQQPTASMSGMSGRGSAAPSAARFWAPAAADSCCSTPIPTIIPPLCPPWRSCSRRLPLRAARQQDHLCGGIVAGGATMKLVYITVSMPFGEGEPFFIPEVQEMLRQGCEMLIVPRSPVGDCFNQDAVGLDERSVRKPLVDPEILATALCVAVRRPIRTLRAFGRLFHSRNVATLLKNRRRVSEGALDRPAGPAMGRRPHPRPMGADDRNDGHGGQRNLGNSVELHRPSRRHRRRQLAGRQAAAGRRSCGSSPRTASPSRNRSAAVRCRATSSCSIPAWTCPSISPSATRCLRRRCCFAPRS